jgi:hypothetical protein
MLAFKRAQALFWAAIVGVVCLAAAERLPIVGGHSFVSTAGAVVGRPLTPVSVAGVARRTARRCAAGVTC